MIITQFKKKNLFYYTFDKEITFKEKYRSQISI